MNNQNQPQKSNFWTIVWAIITANVISIIIGFILFAVIGGSIMSQMGGN